MKSLPTLGRELLGALVVVFAAAVIVAATGIALVLPRLETAAEATIYVAVLVVADVAVFAVFGRYLLGRRVVRPLAEVVEEVEAIAGGDYARKVRPGDTAELDRLADAVNDMAGSLIEHQQELVANVQSLEETNRELTEARDELIRIEKMASVGRLAAGIAHEIGNPLSAILGYMGVLRRGADERRAELIGSAEHEARRIDRIVHGLLDYARPREARPREIVVNEVVEKTVDLLRTQGRLSQAEISVDLADGLPPVTADWNQLQQVLVNLMINALDAIENVAEPRLIVATSLVQAAPRPQLSSRRATDPPDVDYSHRRRFHRTPRLPRESPFPPRVELVRLSVADNGTGIPLEDREHIFEPFYTTKEVGKGTGLGLAVAARLIDGMGGTIRVDSETGHGATFSILLPKADAPEPEGTAA